MEWHILWLEDSILHAASGGFGLALVTSSSCFRRHQFTRSTAGKQVLRIHEHENWWSIMASLGPGETLV